MFAAKSSVTIDIPFQILRYSLLDHGRVIAAHHRDVVLEAMAAKMGEQFTHARQFDDGDAAIHGERVGGKCSVTDVALDLASQIVR